MGCWRGGALAATIAAAGVTAHAQNIPVSVADMVRQASVGDPGSLTWNDAAKNVSAVSPDGEHVAVVIRRGNPQTLTNDAEIALYRTATLLTAPQASVVTRFASATRYQPIALVRWSSGKTLFFAGTQGEQLSQVYRMNIERAQVEQLTHLSAQLQWYDVTASGEWLATISEQATLSPNDDPVCRRSGCLVTEERLHAAEHGLSKTSAPVSVHRLSEGSSRLFAPPEASHPDLVECLDELKGGLSPDGRFALRLCKRRLERWPAWWKEYTSDPDLARVLATGGGEGYLRQWTLYDFVKGTNAELTAAPFSGRNYSSTPIWIDDGRRLLLAGASEPLPNVNDRERAQRARHYAIVTIDPLTGETHRIARLDPRTLQVVATSWDQRTETVEVHSLDWDKKTLPVVSYRRAGKRWVKHAAGSAANMRPVPGLLIRESLNDRPVLVARDPVTGVENTVLDPDPWLAERALGRVEALSWKSKDGRLWGGGLYYPVGYTPGVRYPLVIQTHGFDKNTFSLNGIARNFAAQPLAGVGIAVLQVAENTRGAVGAQEWPAVQAGYESAIDHLDALGLIDRTRVGIHGWSRTGPHMGYTLTQSRYDFAAGVFTMTADFGWWWYLTQGGLSGAHHYGAPPFAEGLDVWQQMSPSFNLHRVRTPMLMCGNGVMGLWDWYIGLRRLGKPVEFWSLPDATHDVFKVGERMRVNQLVVDWFRFWLNGEEDAAPEKVQQYARWREMRGN